MEIRLLLTQSTLPYLCGICLRNYLLESATLCATPGLESSIILRKAEDDFLIQQREDYVPINIKKPAI
ncbi:hypothetical protein AXFE_14610 [Acidithrix ferrooxidans]|uniref:Uncharacterized protein n=1 Tax=Acidithrix ferrooxidans TaxID=1280514 RepID=A0A0D8HKT4_9ACTN|nr:hypothetical protein AXFE_14610 [Acidithrix ferrooxidans]